MLHPRSGLSYFEGMPMIHQLERFLYAKVVKNPIYHPMIIHVLEKWDTLSWSFDPHGFLEATCGSDSKTIQETVQIWHPNLRHRFFDPGYHSNPFDLTLYVLAGTFGFQECSLRPHMKGTWIQEGDPAEGATYLIDLRMGHLVEGWGMKFPSQQFYAESIQVASICHATKRIDPLATRKRMINSTRTHEVANPSLTKEVIDNVVLAARLELLKALDKKVEL
jgi:hypothetical protein